MSAWICENGAFRTPEELRHPHDDRSYLYGDGLFETLRAYGGRPFRARAHAERMRASAEALGLTCRWSAEDLEELFQKTCERNGQGGRGDLYLRATLSRGCGYGPDITAPFAARLVVYANPLPPLPAPEETEGITAVLGREARSARSTLGRHKTTSYLSCLLARREAKDAGAQEALILDTDGYLLEGACGNLFLVRDSRLYTPSLSQNLLPGVARAVALECARAEGIDAEERKLRVEDLFDAEEAFLTNSIQEVKPLVRVERRSLGAGSAGPVTAAIAKAYRQAAERETGRNAGQGAREERQP